MASPAGQRPGVDHGDNGHIARDAQVGRTAGRGHVVCNRIGGVETDDWIAPGVDDKLRLNRRPATSENGVGTAGQVVPSGDTVRVSRDAGVGPDPENRVWIKSYRR